MKFTIDKNIILENLMNEARAISTKNVIPVLNGIKFEMTEEGLYLTARDSELTIKSFIEKKDIKNVEALGNIIIQSKFIVDIIRKMPSDIIDFEVVDGLKIKLTSGFNNVENDGNTKTEISGNLNIRIKTLLYDNLKFKYFYTTQIKEILSYEIIDGIPYTRLKAHVLKDYLYDEEGTK